MLNQIRYGFAVQPRLLFDESFSLPWNCLNSESIGHKHNEIESEESLLLSSISL